MSGATRARGRTLQQVETVAPRIEAWARATYGGAARVAGVRSLGGHSQITLGFDVLDGERVVDALVLKMPPPGVSRRNNFDVLRQVPLLQALEARGLPAPRARWWSSDEAAFGAPFLMMSRLPGRSPPDLFAPEAGQGIADAGVLFGQAIDVLVGLHAIDPARDLAGWTVERALAAEIDHWVQVLEKSTDAAWIRQGMVVHGLLHRTAPARYARGLVHGDFYSNNWVFDGARLSGVVDWEGASVGPSLLDLGWVCMMYDQEAWGPLRRATMAWQPDPERFVARYAAASPHDLADLVWYRALAAYRLACITAYYFERLRSGRSDNPAWLVLGDGFPFLMARAEAQLRARAAD